MNGVRRAVLTIFVSGALPLFIGCSSSGGDSPSSLSSASYVAPSVYAAYSGTDPKASPYPPPALGPANSIFIDPTFGSRILRVTDANTSSGESLIPEDAGYLRTWNANATAFKLMNSHGQSYWVSFDPNNFGVDGASHPNLHPLSFDSKWEWSALDPDTIYFLNGNQIGRYSISTGIATNLGGPQSGEALTFHVAVVGHDNWVCSAAGEGTQDTYTKLFCLNPSNPSQNKLIDIPNHAINNAVQNDPNWPTAAPGQTIGIHSIFGSAGGTWLGVVLHQVSWNPNGEAVLNLSTNTWSLMTSADAYWSGHSSIGNGKYVNGSGSINGMDSRGAILRNPNELMNATQYSFIMQPPSTIGWYDSEHSSWFNASTNPGAPILFSRYNTAAPPTPLPWYGEIVMAATDGSNIVWRFAHNHNGSGAFYGQAFAQVSNDGRWALFSSYWDGELGPSNGDFGIGTRIDTFIVQLS